MNPAKVTITPKTKVGELLDAFPELEQVLIELSPAFAKLKNPVLRKTVARIASLQQAAVVGGLKVEDLVNRLRKEAGQVEFTDDSMNDSYLVLAPPAGFDVSRVTRWFDATPVINAGESPMADILSMAHKLSPGEILELKTPFIPAPILDMLKEKGFTIFAMKSNGIVLSYIWRSQIHD